MQAPSVPGRKASGGAQGNSAAGEGVKLSPGTATDQPTPTATGSKLHSATQDRKGRKSAQAAAPRMPPFDFAHFTGPLVPVVPEV